MVISSNCSAPSACFATSAHTARARTRSAGGRATGNPWLPVRGRVDRFKKEQTARLYEIMTPAPITQDPPKPPKTVMFDDVFAPFKGRVLVSEADVDSFVDALKVQINERVRNNAKVIL